MDAFAVENITTHTPNDYGVEEKNLKGKLLEEKESKILMFGGKN